MASQTEREPLTIFQYASILSKLSKFKIQAVSLEHTSLQKELDMKIKARIGHELNSLFESTIQKYPELSMKILDNLVSLAFARKIELGFDYIIITVLTGIFPLDSSHEVHFKDYHAYSEKVTYKVKIASNILAKVIKLSIKKKSLDQFQFAQFIPRLFVLFFISFTGCIQSAMATYSSQATPVNITEFILHLVENQSVCEGHQFIMDSPSALWYLTAGLFLVRTLNNIVRSSYIGKYKSTTKMYLTYISQLKFLLEELVNHIFSSIGGKCAESYEIHLDIVQEIIIFFTNALHNDVIFDSINFEEILSAFPLLIKVTELIHLKNPENNQVLTNITISTSKCLSNMLQRIQMLQKEGKNIELSSVVSSNIRFLVILMDKCTDDFELLVSGIDSLEKLLLSFRKCWVSSEQFASWEPVSNFIEVASISSKFLVPFLFGLKDNKLLISSKIMKLWPKSCFGFFDFLLNGPNVPNPKEVLTNAVLFDKSVLVGRHETLLKLQFVLRSNLRQIIELLFLPSKTFLVSPVKKETPPPKLASLRKSTQSNANKLPSLPSNGTALNSPEVTGTTYAQIAGVFYQMKEEWSLEEPTTLDLAYSKIYHFFILASSYLKEFRCESQVRDVAQSVLESICTKPEYMCHCVFLTFGSLFSFFAANEDFAKMVLGILWKTIDCLVIDPEKLERFLEHGSKIEAIRRPGSAVSQGIQSQIERAVMIVELCHFLVKYTNNLKERASNGQINRLYCPQCFNAIKKYESVLGDPYIVCNNCGETTENFKLTIQETHEPMLLETAKELESYGKIIKDKLTKNIIHSMSSAIPETNDFFQLSNTNHLARYVQLLII